MIKVDQHYFELIENYRECFNEEQFIARYSDILDKYDYIVGDYGYDQLRLKGFYKDSNKKAEMSKRFSNIQDYIFEYCNFGCPYFVLRRLSKQEVKKLIEEVHPSDVIDDDNKLQDVKIKPTIQDTEH
ncbi:YutD family protein [Staphylococcus aureus]|uniref:YutD family protein n=1 Tax=Staphylococcus aureus TaxID=1280 RepID=UPI001680988D|nr:YutD family protein [Staphylococcus aureus]MBD1445454.1 YutD family protein [Staphylococcus aureus]MBU7617592.1 YutD family protein [Staphylococcus aureus]MBU7638587.1 YutD family protein [Staphylococcus aureus]MBU7641159.1 YutD family protein [Staphylococcus aureus]MBX8175269.1 YutD family protein [Staphylococcus aureus]